MNNSAQLPIGELLIQSGKIQPEDLERALSFQATHGGRLGAVLVRMGALSEDSLLPILSVQLGYPVFEAEQLPSEEIGVPEELEWMQDHHVLIWEREDGNLNAAAIDPLDIELNGEIAERYPGRAIYWHLIRENELDSHLRKKNAANSTGNLDAAHLRELAEDAPIIALVNNLFAEAIDANASDIHIEPGEALFDVRFRVDGVLQTRNRLSMERFPAIASRIKLIARLDIAERRLPQDGRVSIRAAGKELDIRVSVIPASFGESIVMRLLPKQRQDIGLETIGLAPDHLQEMQGWLDHPNGLVLVTGPTGSGKSTTLYSALAAANDLTRKIITVEDPVELRLPRIVQIQVQSEIGYTFAHALRSILRHDPDIILVGEIRDQETAEIAIQAALTGHLVLATLHTNDALSAVTRLTDMGIEAYLVAAALRAVMAQRLVRRICVHCARAALPDAFLEGEWQSLRSKYPTFATIEPKWKSKSGCLQCRNTGYSGRLAIHELVSIDAPLRHAIAAEAPLTNTGGWRNLREDGLLKAARGLTTWDEVCRAIGGTTED